MPRFQSKYYPGVLLTMSGCPYCEKLDSFVEGGSTKKNGTLKFKMGEVRVVNTPAYDKFFSENDLDPKSVNTFPSFMTREKKLITGSNVILKMFKQRQSRSNRYNRFGKVKARGRQNDDTSSSGTSSGTSSDEDSVPADSCRGLACA